MKRSMSFGVGIVLCLSLAACGPRMIRIRSDNAGSWVRSVEGPIVIYRISMSGVPPYTEVIVGDEATARGFNALVPESVHAERPYGTPAMRVWSLPAYEKMLADGIASLTEDQKNTARPYHEHELAKIRRDLQDHTAVVLYSYQPPR
jgi:hypothetical protein